MIARLLRLVILLALAAAVALLIFYAFVAALIILPVVLVLFFLFGRKTGNVWIIGGGPRSPRSWPPQPETGRPAPGSGPVIDHDPSDLPEKQP